VDQLLLNDDSHSRRTFARGWKWLPLLPHSRYQSVAAIIDQHTLMVHSGELTLPPGSTIKRNHMITLAGDINTIVNDAKWTQEMEAPVAVPGGIVTRTSQWLTHVTTIPVQPPDDEDDEWVMLPSPAARNKPPPPFL
jgi:hypothetical protein